MIRTSLKLFCLAVCVAMTWWLVRNEAFPGRFADTFSGYRGMMSSGTLLVDSWTKVLYEGEPIGYSHTQLAAPEESEEEATRLENHTVLNMKVLGATQRISATATAALDGSHRLQRFNFALHSLHYQARIEGERKQGDLFTIRIHTAAGVSESELQIPDDVIVYSPMTEMAMRRLKPGQQLRIKTLDPVSLSVADVICTAVRREQIELGGKEIAATLLTVNYQGMTMRSWINSEGKTVRQETPLGWVMESCSQQDAMTLQFDTAAMDDMILANAVPISGGSIEVGQTRRLTLTLSGLHLPPEQLASPRQEVETLSATEARVVLHAAQLPDRGTPLGEIPEDAGEFLAATPYVQADHPDIRARARAIVGDTDDSLEASQRLYEWVRRNITKNPTVSLPSALDVLEQRVGDCNEHTYLYVALARSIGIPAQIRIGLVFSRGAFYYHAWPSVWVGEWVELDPTLEQPAVDATHLALLEGELGKQLELMKVIGRLHARVEPTTP